MSSLAPGFCSHQRTLSATISASGICGPTNITVVSYGATSLAGNRLSFQVNLRILISPYLSNYFQSALIHHSTRGSDDRRKGISAGEKVCLMTKPFRPGLKQPQLSGVDGCSMN